MRSREAVSHYHTLPCSALPNNRHPPSIVGARELIHTMEMSKHQKTLLEIIPLHGIHRAKATATGLIEATAIILRYRELVNTKDKEGLKQYCAEKAPEMAARQKV